MYKNIKHIKLFILTLALVLFSISTNAQEVRVIDNKGTIQNIKSNTVNTSTSASESTPATFTFPAGYTAIENDTFIYKPTTGEKVYYIYDGTEWNMIAPTKAARVFYPPSIAIDASSTGTGRTINLYSSYFSQFNGPLIRSDIGGANEAPASIPTYAANELYYYVTDYDTSILTINSIDSSGLMTYSVDAIPTDDNTIINVVFVVK
ncbi:hypothetical protein [Tenacibaculum crassostreae]|uniref:hypothetical protein n=1 Tax=Tenacibaculum crassostreae TaxID=502683 RepID=UPI0038966524